MHHYHAFGLKLESNFPVPELHPGCGPPDVRIRLRRGAQRGDADSPWLDGGGDRIVLRLDDIVFAVSGGRSIEILAPPDSGENDVRIWLLGTVFAAVLHQRGYYALHANAVRLPGGGAAAFSGPSGAGKSTLAALLDRRGFRVLGDDLCAVRLDAGQAPLIHAGIPRLKLWEATLDLFGRSTAGLERVASDLLKFHVPLACASETGPLTPFALERLYLLDTRGRDNQPLLTRPNGADAAAAVLDNAFRWSIGQTVAGSESRLQFDQAMAIARDVAVFRVARRWGTDQLFDEAALVADHLSAPLTNSEQARGVAG